MNEISWEVCRGERSSLPSISSTSSTKPILSISSASSRARNSNEPRLRTPFSIRSCKRHFTMLSYSTSVGNSQLDHNITCSNLKIAMWWDIIPSHAQVFQRQYQHLVSSWLSEIGMELPHTHNKMQVLEHPHTLQNQQTPIHLKDWEVKIQKLKRRKCQQNIRNPTGTSSVKYLSCQFPGR